jgi:hypothetical protein
LYQSQLVQLRIKDVPDEAQDVIGTLEIQSSQDLQNMPKLNLLSMETLQIWSSQMKL